MSDNELDGTLLGELEEIVLSCKEDYLKATKSGVKLAGRRVRKKMMEVKRLYKDIRDEISEKTGKK